MQGRQRGILEAHLNRLKSHVFGNFPWRLLGGVHFFRPLSPYPGNGCRCMGGDDTLWREPNNLPMPILTLTHGIPIWFLVLSLFLPRVSLFIGWIHMWWFFVPQPFAAILWVFLPRVLVLIFIHAHHGFDVWFWIHLVTAILVWGRSGAYHNNRRLRRRRT